MTYRNDMEALEAIRATLRKRLEAGPRRVLKARIEAQLEALDRVLRPMYERAEAQAAKRKAVEAERRAEGERHLRVVADAVKRDPYVCGECGIRMVHPVRDTCDDRCPYRAMSQRAAGSM